MGVDLVVVLILVVPALLTAGAFALARRRHPEDVERWVPLGLLFGWVGWLVAAFWPRRRREGRGEEDGG